MKNKDKEDLEPFTTMLTKSNKRNLKVKAAKEGKTIFEVLNETLAKNIK